MRNTQKQTRQTETWGKSITRREFNMHKVKRSESRSVVSYSLQPHGPYSPWNSPDQNTGVSSSSFLQGIFPTQELNRGLLHCRWILYQLSCQGSPTCLKALYLKSLGFLMNSKASWYVWSMVSKRWGLILQGHEQESVWYAKCHRKLLKPSHSQGTWFNLC